MRQTPSQTATISLPAEMLDALDETARRMTATRSEIVRAALRDYLRRMQREEAVLARNRLGTGSVVEEGLAQVARRARPPAHE